MKIHTEILESFLAESITICLLQLESPFDDILAKTWRSDGHYFGPIKENEDKYRRRIQRLADILNALQQGGHKIDVLVLPEYGFLKNDAQLAPDGLDTQGRLSKYSESLKAVIIGNCYDTERRLSETFAIIPSAYIRPTGGLALPKIISAYKISRSRYDTDALAVLPKEDEKILRFEWCPASAPDKKAYIQILTCKDYLYFTSVAPLRDFPEVIRLDVPGVIICPACSPEVHSFETRALAMMRDLDVEQGDLRACLKKKSAQIT
jgi:hypothetical protein